MPVRDGRRVNSRVGWASALLLIGGRKSAICGDGSGRLGMGCCVLGRLDLRSAARNER